MTILADLRLRNLPPYAKTFVGIFTALMLCVCLWAAWIYTARYGVVDTRHLPAYLTETKNDVKQDINELKSDSEAVMAPVWDAKHAGEEQKIDSATLEAIKRRPLSNDDQFDRASDRDRNLGLGHTHLNGQTLLFFAIGLVFLFSSATPRTKKIIYWIFGAVVLTHNLGLTLRSYYSVFGDLLAISGILILLTIAYMAFVIFTDLAKKPTGQ
jgi:hypothetical protein